MKLLYYLAAFGNSNLERKREILFHNLNYIFNDINENFSIAINFYDINDDIKFAIKQLLFIENIYIYEKQGVLTELFLTNNYLDSNINLYDYIIFILNNFKIININIKNMIEIKNKHKIEILSPKINNASHSFMYTEQNLTLNNKLEFFLYLLTPKDFFKFCSIHTIKNKWMWGVDYLFGYYKIRAGLINTYVAQHELRDSNASGEAWNLACDYLTEKTPYTSFHDIIDPPVYEVIAEYV